MTGERWRRVRELVARILELPVDERDAYLLRECGDDAELRAEVESLAAVESEEGFLDPPATELVWEGEGAAARRLAEFELLEEVGRGGFGIVHLARDTRLNRLVALKVLSPALSLSERHVERFRREARAAARLRHPGIVTVHRADEAGDVHFIAMEFVPGPALSSVLDDIRAGRQNPASAALPLDPEGMPIPSASAELVAQVADALDYAHGEGIVHRDVKPQNLIMENGTTPRLADFGLAQDQNVEAMTRSGELGGTYFYMSPEQALAKRVHIDHRTDVFSLGAVLYELLTLERAFDGMTSKEVLDRISFKQPVSPRRLNHRVPRDLEVICYKALEKDRDLRYESAGALADDLRRFLAHEAITARPPSWRRRVGYLVARHRLPIASAFVAILVGVGAIQWERHVTADEAARALADDFHRTTGILETGLDNASLGERRLLVRASQALEGHEDRLTPESRTELEKVRTELSRWRVTTESVWREALERSSSLGGDPSAQEWRRAEAQNQLQTLAFLFPDKEELHAYTDPERFMPRLSVAATDRDGAPTAARVAVRLIDWKTGQPGPRGALHEFPITDHALVPGYYRVVVEFESGGIREFVRYLTTSSGTTNLTAKRSRDETAITADMVSFPAGEFRVSPASNLQCRGETVPFEAYHLDPYEVTNSEYEEFLRANPDQLAPKYWDGPRPESWSELPVVGVTWYDAVAYAEWRGKRLPTLVEWLRAGQGLEGRDYPWPKRADGTTPASNSRVPAYPEPETYDENRAVYLEHAAGVRSFPEARTPEGIFNMYGNVREWTETMMMKTDAEQPFPFVWERIWLGGCWLAQHNRQKLWSIGHSSVGRRDATEKIGFRCARSAVK